MESTKEVLVRRSNNLLYFPSNLNGDLYKATPFRNNGITFTKTLDDVHFEGEWDGTENTSGSWGIAYCNITLAAGTYTLSNDENYQGQTIINKKVDKDWVNVALCGYGNHKKTFTITETTVIGRMFWSNAIMDKNVPIDMWMHPMLVEGDAKQDYEPYYREYESTKEVLVRRSNNLFLPFTSNSNMQIDVPFSWDGTGEPLMTCTLQKDGNIRMRGTVTKGAGGGYVSITNLTGGLVFKAGKTYNFSINPDCQCTMQLFRQKDGAWENIYQFSGTWAGGAIKTFTEDTIPTRIFMNFSGSSTVKAGDEIDVLINPMLVEGDTKQDYEPYYYEAEASKTGIIPDDGSLTSVVDFSTAIKGKRISITSTTSPEGSDGVTINNNDAFAYVPEYYPCQAGDIYKIEYVGQENLPKQTYRQYFIFWYDENKNYLGFYIKYTYGAYTFDPAPTNAKFFRLTYSGLLNGAVTPKEWMLPSNPKLTKVTS